MVLMSELSMEDVNLEHWTSFTMGAFRENFRCICADGNSFWLGVGLNSRSIEWKRVRLDWNPNKVSKSRALQSLFNFLCSKSKPMHREIKRFDLAIDIPVDRQSCILVKDNRVYSERRHGKQWTQYLGAKSSHVGRVKLYNKQLEANLSYPLTRLELTLSPDLDYKKINFPTVYYIDNSQVALDEMKATDTDRFILNSVLQGVGTTRELGRKTREKIESLMTHYVKQITISENEYRRILEQLEKYRTTGLAL